MKYVGLFGILLVFASCESKTSPDTRIKESVPKQLESINIDMEQPRYPAVKYHFPNEPDAELTYFDEHFDDYFDDPEDGITYPDEIFDFYID